MLFVALSSSRGTTLGAVLDRIADGSLMARCIGLVTDRPDRGCVEVAKQHKVRVTVVPKVQGESREAYDKKIDAAIRAFGAPDLLCALGWMWILSPWFVRAWPRKILNVHPALLPKHPGAHAIAETLASGDELAGMTIHLIDEGVDTGPIILQKSCPVTAGETEESLKQKIQALEKEWYPNVLRDIASGDVVLP